MKCLKAGWPLSRCSDVINHELRGPWSNKKQRNKANQWLLSEVIHPHSVMGWVTQRATHLHRLTTSANSPALKCGSANSAP